MMISFLQEVFFCDPNGYNGVDTVEFQFGCTSCPGADTPFFFRIDLQALGTVIIMWEDFHAWEGGSKVITHNNCTLVEGNLGMRLLLGDTVA